jgi:catechol 2,3-dioxygenase-like lactoylglutathione lyase family enzyme
MRRAISCVTLLVRDYDEAIAFYVGALGFRVAEDAQMGGGRRWVLLAPPGPAGCALQLARAKNAREAAAVGDQAGGRVFLFLSTDDFDRDHARMRAHGVRFDGEPRVEAYGKVAVFLDLYGNRWDLVMPPS